MKSDRPWVWLPAGFGEMIRLIGGDRGGDIFAGRWKQWTAVVLLLGMIGSGNQLRSQTQYDGVWLAANVDNKIWVDAQWPSFQSKWEELSSQNYRLVDIETRVVGGERKYFGLWHPGNDRYKLWVGVEWSAFKTRWEEWRAEGLRLVDLEIYLENGRKEFIGVWREGSDEERLLYDLDWVSFKQKNREYRQQQLNLMDVETYEQEGQRRYAGLWRGTAAEALVLGELSWETLSALARGLGDNDLVLSDLESYPGGGAEKYLGIWKPREVQQELLINTDWPSYLKNWRQYLNDGFQLVDLEVSGEASGGAVSVSQSAVRESESAVSGGNSEPSPPPAAVTAPGDGRDSYGDRGATLPQEVVKVEYGKASYYGDRFHGKPTASGEPYLREKLTAAHRTLPFGTLVRVTNIANNRSVVVRINDRGPHSKERIIDLSHSAADQLDAIRAGIIDVKVEVLK